MPPERWERATRVLTRVLVVDDNPTARFLCATALAPVFDVTTAATVDEALRVMRLAPADAVVVDLELGRDTRQDGMRFLEEVARSWPDTRRIVFGGYETPDIAARVEHPAVQTFVRKAGPMGALVAAIRG